MATQSSRYAKSFTPPWKNSFVFDNTTDLNGNSLVANTAPITDAFSADVFGTFPTFYSSWVNPASVRVDHFKMPVQTKPVQVENFHLEATIGFSNRGGFMNTGTGQATPEQQNPASAMVIVLLWHQKAAYLHQEPNGAPNTASLYIPLGGFTRNIFTPMMQPYQDLIIGMPGHIDRFVGYHNKMREVFSSSTGRKLSQDDTIAVSIVYQWMPLGNPNPEQGGLRLPPLEGTVALTYSALS